MMEPGNITTYLIKSKENYIIEKFVYLFRLYQRVSRRRDRWKCTTGIEDKIPMGPVEGTLVEVLHTGLFPRPDYVVKD